MHTDTYIRSRGFLRGQCDPFLFSHAHQTWIASFVPTICVLESSTKIVSNRIYHQKWLWRFVFVRRIYVLRNSVIFNIFIFEEPSNKSLAMLRFDTILLIWPDVNSSELRPFSHPHTLTHSSYLCIHIITHTQNTPLISVCIYNIYTSTTTTAGKKGSNCSLLSLGMARNSPCAYVRCSILMRSIVIRTSTPQRNTTAHTLRFRCSVLVSRLKLFCEWTIGKKYKQDFSVSSKLSG